MALFEKHLSIATLLLFGLIVVAQGYICSNPHRYVGQSVCDFQGGQCGASVSYVKVCSDDRRSTNVWTRGRKVHRTDVIRGTTIGTFPRGKYSGHAAVYISQNTTGILVYDQWQGHPVKQRTIPWNGDGVLNEGDSYYVIN